jgi:hypothetical protein
VIFITFWCDENDSMALALTMPIVSITLFSMTLPAYVFGVILSSLYGAAFHLWRDGGIARLILYLFLSWLGFWVGHFLAEILGWTFGSVGPLHIGLATISSIFFLFMGHWLSKVEVQRK